MERKNISYFKLEGSNEEMGQQLAAKVASNLGVMKAPETFADEDLNEALDLYKRYCPGMVIELESFAKAKGVSLRDVAFTWMTYLVPRCSGLIAQGRIMEDDSTRLVRNYEFDLDHEDLMLFETRPKGMYAHIGGSVALFGRTEGVNACGLAVSMSSCGLPVSNMPGMRPPKIKGLQFWAVIRSVLENCRNVNEALELVKEMPIAYNINLFLADETGAGCIVETMDGHFVYEKISSDRDKKYLCATNHIVIPAFQKNEPYAMRNSLVRLQTLERFMEGKAILSESDITTLFLKKYPEGLSTRYYDDFFGTVKTVVMDTKTRTYKIRWLLEKENGWDIYALEGHNKDHVLQKKYVRERAEPDFFESVRL